uniref:Developmentally regulated GTP binding protein 2 n=1 Tax=Suricata suricatta TaxID=37032 RepID=A0A673UMY2_SURSU
MGILEKISEIEKEIARTQKNKATEYHLGLLKAKLAKYRAQLLEPSKSASSKGEGFDVMKSGDARVALIGFPSVGKSTFLSLMTSTASEAASYEFTTLTCIPGVIEYKGANIQLLDLPGIIEGAAQGIWCPGLIGKPDVAAGLHRYGWVQRPVLQGLWPHTVLAGPLLKPGRLRPSMVKGPAQGHATQLAGLNSHFYSVSLDGPLQGLTTYQLASSGRAPRPGALSFVLSLFPEIGTCLWRLVGGGCVQHCGRGHQLMVIEHWLVPGPALTIISLTPHIVL